MVSLSEQAHSTEPRIKVMADYGCHPLWAVEGGPGNLDPTKLPIRRSLQLALAAWAEWHNETLDESYPPNSGFADEAEQTAFVTTGRMLAERLARHGALGPVVYFDHSNSTLVSIHVEGGSHD